MKVDQRYLISPEVREELKNRKEFMKKLSRGQSLQTILQFSDKVMLEFYGIAQGLMDQKKYGDAADAFFFLSQVAPQVKAFWLGMARCERFNENFEQAIPLYVTAIALENSDREVYLEAVRCCLAAGKIEEAIQILDLLLAYVEENKESPEAEELHAIATQCKEWIIAQYQQGTA